MGVMDWRGLNPLPPEMWLLPYSKWTGVGYLHPGRYWCHCRMVRRGVHRDVQCTSCVCACAHVCVCVYVCVCGA